MRHRLAVGLVAIGLLGVACGGGNRAGEQTLTALSVGAEDQETAGEPVSSRSSECSNALKEMEKTSEVAGVYRLGDQERAVRLACTGSDEAVQRAAQLRQEASASLSEPCRGALANVDNVWYRDAAGGKRELNAQSRSRLRHSVSKLEQACDAERVGEARQQLPGVFALIERWDSEAARANQERERRNEAREAYHRAQEVPPLPVARLIRIFDTADGGQLKKELDVFHRQSVPLDNGQRPSYQDVVYCYNWVTNYRSQRAKCGTPKWYEADCLSALLREGEWRDSARALRADADRSALPSGRCGFEYSRFNAELSQDRGEAARYERRLATLEKLARLRRARMAQMEAAALAAARKERSVILAGHSDELCKLHSSLSQVEKQLAFQARLDRESGTVDARRKRELTRARLVLREQIAAARRAYVSAGGHKKDAAKSTTAFWCKRPTKSKVLEQEKEKALRKLLAKNQMSALALCQRGEWGELAKAVGAKRFQTCEFEDVGGDSTPMPEPEWEWLKSAKRTGEEFAYAVADESLTVYVFVWRSGAWTLVRTETCSYAGGGLCVDASEFAVQERPGVK